MRAAAQAASGLAERDLVLGRIAEAYGLRDDAVAAYRRVAPSRPQEGSGSNVLAAARLEKLGAPR